MNADIVEGKIIDVEDSEKPFMNIKNLASEI